MVAGAEEVLDRRKKLALWLDNVKPQPKNVENSRNYAELVVFKILLGLSRLTPKCFSSVHHVTSKAHLSKENLGHRLRF